jgi:outer membrane protein assembly factor BamE
LLLSAAALTPACKSLEVPKVPGVTPYRMVIQQGNFISQEMVAQLKPGMTKEQVRFILGTPLVNDIFHADRWDYVFYREGADGKREQRNLSVVFEKDKLARVLGDLLPSGGSAAVQSTGFESQTKPAATAKPAAAAKPDAAAKPTNTSATQPALEAPKPAAETAKPEPAGQNWGTASDQVGKQPEAKPQETAAPKAEEKNAAEDDNERGFFGRMLEKIGL